MISNQIYTRSSTCRKGKIGKGTCRLTMSRAIVENTRIIQLTTVTTWVGGNSSINSDKKKFH